MHLQIVVRTDKARPVANRIRRTVRTPFFSVPTVTHPILTVRTAHFSASHHRILMQGVSVVTGHLIPITCRIARTTRTAAFSISAGVIVLSRVTGRLVHARIFFTAGPVPVTVPARYTSYALCPVPIRRFSRTCRTRRTPVRHTFRTAVAVTPIPRLAMTVLRTLHAPVSVIPVPGQMGIVDTRYRPRSVATCVLRTISASVIVRKILLRSTAIG